MNLVRRRMSSILVLVAVMGLLGCQGSDSEANPSGMGVEAALGLQSTEALTVTGYVVAYEGGEVVLADELTPAMPPEPEGPTIEVAGLDEEVPTWESSDGVRWTTNTVRVSGTMRDGVLTATATKASEKAQ